MQRQPLPCVCVCVLQHCVSYLMRCRAGITHMCGRRGSSCSQECVQTQTTLSKSTSSFSVPLQCQVLSGSWFPVLRLNAGPLKSRARQEKQTLCMAAFAIPCWLKWLSGNPALMTAQVSRFLHLPSSQLAACWCFHMFFPSWIRDAGAVFETYLCFIWDATEK